MLLRTATVVAFANNVITLSVVDEDVRKHAEEISGGVKGALDHEFKMPMTLHWVVGHGAAPAAEPATLTPSRPTASVSGDTDDDDTMDEDSGTPETEVTSVASHLISEMFPGATEIS